MPRIAGLFFENSSRGTGTCGEILSLHHCCACIRPWRWQRRACPQVLPHCRSRRWHRRHPVPMRRPPRMYRPRRFRPPVMPMPISRSREHGAHRNRPPPDMRSLISRTVRAPASRRRGIRSSRHRTRRIRRRLPSRRPGPGRPIRHKAGIRRRGGTPARRVKPIRVAILRVVMPSHLAIPIPIPIPQRFTGMHHLPG